MNRYLIAVFTSLFLIVVLSCNKKPRAILSADRDLVDSAYKVRIDSVKELIDSLCLALNESEYDKMMDSIINVRAEEIQILQNQ